MAGYKAHMAFGMVTALGWTVLAVMFSIISLWFIPLIFITTVLGAFLPDLDSDTGMPMKILLLMLSATGAVMIGWIIINQDGITLIKLGGYTVFSALFIYFGIGWILKKLTHHRGIFHSIPACIVSILLPLLFLDQFELDLKLKMALSLGVGFGYLCHLILDEMNSVVNLGGIPFIPNKSSGTALKFYSKNWRINFIVYTLIGWLSYQNWGTVMEFIKEL